MRRNALFQVHNTSMLACGVPPPTLPHFLNNSGCVHRIRSSYLTGIVTPSRNGRIFITLLGETAAKNQNGAYTRRRDIVVA